MDVDTECGVCCRAYTAKVRVPVTCPTCQHTTCTACVKTYLLSNFQDPHCMKDTCRRPWNDEFLDAHLTTAFRTGALKVHRQNVLVERQRALLPARQGLVERHRALLAAQAVQAVAKQEFDTASALQFKEGVLWRAMDAALRHLRSGPHQLTRTTCGRLFDVPQACVFEGDRRTCVNCSTGLCGECGFVWFAYNEAAGLDHVCVPRPRTPEELSVVDKRMTREVAAQKAVYGVANGRAGEVRVRLHHANFDVAQVRFPVGRAPQGGAAADERAKFVRQCPVSACRGFLSTAWKCGTCDTWACANCHEVKGATKDAPHTCNPDCVASARLLEKETRPCPKCASAIFKISGCFAPHTPILMWSGDVKLSQEVVVGDQMVGDDGLPRTVLRTIHGEDEMFEIGQTHGASYTVNQYHTLALKSSSSKDGVVELTVRDFLSTPPSMQGSLQGFKLIAGGIDYPAMYSMPNPYLMGAHIGDGIRLCAELNAIAWPAGGGAHVVTQMLQKEKEFAVRDEKEEKEHTDPEILQALRAFTIPRIYMHNSREVRMQVLAGIMDTYGRVAEQTITIEIGPSNPLLAKHLAFLSRSLGFSVHVSDDLVVSVNGDMSEIPTRSLKMSSRSSSRSAEDLARSGLTVKPMGRGIYYGWEVDGNHRFLLEDFTVVRNCDQMWCTACNNGFDWRTGKEIRTGAIHNPHFFEFMGRGGGAAAAAAGAGGAAAANAPQQQPGLCGAAQEHLPLMHVMHGRLSVRSSAQPMEESRNAFQRIMVNYMRLGHLTDTALRTYTRRANNVNVADEEKLAVEYLMGIIDDRKWREQLQRGEKRRHKYVAILQVLEMYTQTGASIINRGITETSTSLLDIEAQLAALKQYSHEAMRTVSHRYQCIVPEL